MGFNSGFKGLNYCTAIWVRMEQQQNEDLKEKNR